MTTSLTIIRDYRQFRTLKDDWNRLVERNYSSGVWLRHEWYDCWWQAFGGNAQMFVVTMSDNEQLAAVLPLLIIPMSIKGSRQRVLRFMENGITPRSNFIIPDITGAKLKAIWTEIFAHSAEWDLAILANIEQGNVGYEQWREYLDANQVRHVELPERVSPFIRIDTDIATVRAGFGKRLKRNLSNVRNRLERSGGFSLVCCSTPDEVQIGLKEAFEVSANSWKGRLGKNIGGNKEREFFYRSIAMALVQQGRVRIWLLRHKERTIAYEYTLHDRDHVLLLAIDYNLEFAAFSPGSVLRNLVLEQLAGRQFRIYDFSGTNYDYKLHWTRSVRPHSQFWIFHSGLKSRLLYLIKAKVLPAFERAAAKTPPPQDSEADGEE
ncbi:MAG: GNAT family N-acetyltransferase [Candidatus Zixiibacteriota bacterium]